MKGTMPAVKYSKYIQHLCDQAVVNIPVHWLILKDAMAFENGKYIRTLQHSRLHARSGANDQHIQYSYVLYMIIIREV